MPYHYIDVRPVAGALGAEIREVDLSQPLQPSVLQELNQTCSIKSALHGIYHQLSQNHLWIDFFVRDTRRGSE